MEARDLRIGNWVQHVGGWSYRSDTEQHFDFEWNESDWYALGECTLSLDNIKPIPLTEEWLLKFGFVKGLDYNQYGISCGRLDFFRSRYGITIRYNDEHRQVIDIPIKYVHQLQNLYFALTGDELAIK